MTKELSGPTVAEAMAQDANNFTLVRLGLALAVVLSHAFSVTSGSLIDEPLTASTGFTLGEHAVNGFFAISGFLVTMSFDRRGWRDYVIARTLRIAPGLIVAVLAVGLVLGPLMSRLPLGEYLASAELWRFITATLTTFKSNTVLPGVFEANPFRFPMGTVWTLKYEVLCYAGVLVAGLAGLLRWRMAGLVLVAALALGLLGLDALNPEPPKGIETALRLPLIFACGAALYLWRDSVRLSLFAAFLAVMGAMFLKETFLYKTALFMASSYAILWLCLVPVRYAVEPGADLSYGTYLYGWPVQQALHALFPTAAALTLLAPSLAITLGVAALSWFGIEKPALRLKARALGLRTLKTIEPAGP
ncbi:acyltransferase family protein [Microvirga pudoricolor]|uniref:acyltransferase family protein n=1 Tax=Microvirga pudoricolor TaxID=2778729 RepID=UPI001950CF38|nr:acyltransferase [Microvirga pudoricolor]MBM6596108.1 acyltransferase [Microvirga pudoricolor]